MGNIGKHRRQAIQATALLAIASCVLGPSAHGEDDAISREFTVFAGGGQSPLVDAVAREFVVFAGMPGAVAMDDVAAREFTVFAGSLEPQVPEDSVAREFTVLVIEPSDFAITDAVAREFVVHVPAGPQVILAASPLGYTEGDGAVAIDPLAGVFDPDTGDFGGGELRVELTDGASAGDTIDIGHEDPAAAIRVEGDRIFYHDVGVATFTGGGVSPLSVVFDAGTGIDPVVAVVRHVRFSNALRFPDAGMRTAEFRLSDAETGFGTPSNRGIAVVPVNHPPTAGPDFAGVEMDVPMVLPNALLLANDNDADGDAMTLGLTATTSAAGGSIMSDGGGISYTPPEGFTGTDRFDYELSDAYSGHATGRVTLFVRAADDPSCSVLSMIIDEESGAFTLDAVGLPGRTYDLLASETLMRWAPAAVVMADVYGRIFVIDPDAPEHPKRFYKFDFHTAE